MKQYQNAANLVHVKSINLGKIKGLILVFLLAIGSTAVLAGCKGTPTASNSPATSDSPLAENSPTVSETTKTEAFPTASTSPPASETTKTEAFPTASTSPPASETTKTETSPAASTSPATSNTPNAAAITKAEQALKELYTKQTGVAIESVDCPDNVNFKAGSAFECQGSAEGINFGIQVKMENEQGRFDSKTEGLLILSKIEDLLETGIKKQAGIDVTADCGGKLRVAKAGDSFTCEVKNDKGQTRNAKVTVKDEQGNINVKII